MSLISKMLKIQSWIQVAFLTSLLVGVVLAMFLPAVHCIIYKVPPTYSSYDPCSMWPYRTWQWEVSILAYAICYVMYVALGFTGHPAPIFCSTIGMASSLYLLSFYLSEFLQESKTCSSPAVHLHTMLWLLSVICLFISHFCFSFVDFLAKKPKI